MYSRSSLGFLNSAGRLGGESMISWLDIWMTRTTAMTKTMTKVFRMLLAVIIKDQLSLGADSSSVKEVPRNGYTDK